MNSEQIVIVVLSVVIVALLIVIAALVFSQQKKRRATKDATYEKNGVRYTYKDDTASESGQVVVNFKEGDIALKKGTTYAVSKAGPILPGKYVMLSGEENASSFNVRIGKFVRPYSHESDIVLAEGETICPVSHSIVLR